MYFVFFGSAEFTWFGCMAFAKACKFTCFGDIHGPTSNEFIGIEAMAATKPQTVRALMQDPLRSGQGPEFPLVFVFVCRFLCFPIFPALL